MFSRTKIGIALLATALSGCEEGKPVPSAAEPEGPGNVRALDIPGTWRPILNSPSSGHNFDSQSLTGMTAADAACVLVPYRSGERLPGQVADFGHGLQLLNDMDPSKAARVLREITRCAPQVSKEYFLGLFTLSIDRSLDVLLSLKERPASGNLDLPYAIEGRAASFFLNALGSESREMLLQRMASRDPRYARNIALVMRTESELETGYTGEFSCRLIVPSLIAVEPRKIDLPVVTDVPTIEEVLPRQYIVCRADTLGSVQALPNTDGAVLVLRHLGSQLCAVACFQNQDNIEESLDRIIQEFTLRGVSQTSDIGAFVVAKEHEIVSQLIAQRLFESGIKLEALEVSLPTDSSHHAIQIDLSSGTLSSVCDVESPTDLDLKRERIAILTRPWRLLLRRHQASEDSVGVSESHADHSFLYPANFPGVDPVRLFGHIANNHELLVLKNAFNGAGTEKNVLRLARGREEDQLSQSALVAKYAYPSELLNPLTNVDPTLASVRWRVHARSAAAVIVHFRDHHYSDEATAAENEKVRLFQVAQYDLVFRFMSEAKSPILFAEGVTSELLFRRARARLLAYGLEDRESDLRRVINTNRYLFPSSADEAVQLYTKDRAVVGVRSVEDVIFGGSAHNKARVFVDVARLMRADILRRAWKGAAFRLAERGTFKLLPLEHVLIHDLLCKVYLRGNRSLDDRSTNIRDADFVGRVLGEYAHEGKVGGPILLPAILGAKHDLTHEVKHWNSVVTDTPIALVEITPHRLKESFPDLEL